MYKTITEGTKLVITGENLYSGDTQVFFNTTSNEIPVLPNSFNEDHSQVAVTVPCCLPDLNDVIVYNGIDYYTGDAKYRFYGLPSISNISDDSLRWEESAIVDGKYLLETTAVTIGSTQADYHVESPSRVVVTCPIDVPSGVRDLEITTVAGTAKTSIDVLEAEIEGELDAVSYTAGRAFGESGQLIGKGLHRVNRILVQAYPEAIHLAAGPNGFVNHGTTGISFRVPDGALDKHSVSLRKDNGYFLNGYYIPDVEFEHLTSTTLRIKSPHISSISVEAAKYQDPITISGSQVQNCKILFQGHNVGNINYIEANTLSTGQNNIVIEMPRGAIRSRLIASGYTENTSEAYTSSLYVYPIPTITGLSSTAWVVGGQVEIDAVNASEARPLVGVYGYDRLRAPNDYILILGTWFVSSPDRLTFSQAKYFGTASIDNSSLESNMPESLQTGVTKITAIINAEMIGTANPFLASKHDGGIINDLSTFSSEVQYKALYHEVVSISGKAPEIYGISSNRATKLDQIKISGRYLMTTKKLHLKSSTETKTITSGQYVESDGVNHEKIDFLDTGVDNNFYEQVHFVKVNLSDFSFVGQDGTFEFETPSI